MHADASRSASVHHVADVGPEPVDAAAAARNVPPLDDHVEIAHLATLLGLDDVCLRGRRVVDGALRGWRIRLDGEPGARRWAGGIEVRVYDGPARPYVSVADDRPGVTCVLDGAPLRAATTVGAALLREPELAVRARRLGERFRIGGRDVALTALATGEIVALVRPGAWEVEDPPLAALVDLCVDVADAWDRAGIPVRLLAVARTSSTRA